MIEDMAVLHITEAELARDVHAVIEKVRKGAEVVIEQDSRPVAVIKAPALGPGRLIDECIALAEQREKERGYRVTLDPDFAADVEEIVAQRKPLDTSAWD
jgi:antitoxin (DNA-binding transcriptional repressor) of toxin-antitoxin stability system